MQDDIIIKGMVCERCVSFITAGITQMGYTITGVSLGKVSLAGTLTIDDQDRIRKFLTNNGFDLIASRQVKTVHQIKALVEKIFRDDFGNSVKRKFSELLAQELHMNYDSMSQMFKTVEGITLEKYIITKRLEKVKELLVYSNYSLTEIAFQTGFSSINHLSRQFKELTGFPPSHFKSLRSPKKNDCWLAFATPVSCTSWQPLCWSLLMLGDIMILPKYINDFPFTIYFNYVHVVNPLVCNQFN